MNWAVVCALDFGIDLLAVFIWKAFFKASTKLATNKATKWTEAIATTKGLHYYQVDLNIVMEERRRRIHSGRLYQSLDENE